MGWRLAKAIDQGRGMRNHILYHVHKPSNREELDWIDFLKLKVHVQVLSYSTVLACYSAKINVNMILNITYYSRLQHKCHSKLNVYLELNRCSTSSVLIDHQFSTHIYVYSYGVW